MKLVWFCLFLLTALFTFLSEPNLTMGKAKARKKIPCHCKTVLGGCKGALKDTRTVRSHQKRDQEILEKIRGRRTKNSVPMSSFCDSDLDNQGDMDENSFIPGSILTEEEKEDQDTYCNPFRSFPEVFDPVKVLTKTYHLPN